ncbi:MAG: ADP-heptose synthase [Ignavibacteriae bacterium]|nr:MAG: ADP-heptose synthase [Ignavibacteriota bacterium]
MGKIVNLDELKILRQEFRKKQQKVVFTNGVFDILHRGHIEYLNKAKKLGDILVVGINSDDSVRKIKGNKRPIVKQDDRAYLISNICCVDFVCIFKEETPLNLISEIIPDVLVKGADWNKENIVGKDIVENNGGKVETIEFVPQCSTTNIIDIIIERYCNQ